MEEKFTFFWNGPFSQWKKSKFVLNGIEYNCCEKFMMSMKAKYFKDEQIYSDIMNTDDPAKQKLYGRTVKNFEVDKWNKIAKSVVYVGNCAKFTQNKDLLDLLLETRGTTLVEASPFDKIWGIGLSEDDPLAQNRKTWKGTNWLGEILTKVREDILNNVTFDCIDCDDVECEDFSLIITEGIEN